MTITETVCSNCGEVISRDEPSPYCPECGTENPWTEQPAFEFDEADLPVVFSYEVYDDGYGLWREFCSEYFGTPELTGTDIAGLPDEIPDLEYCMFDAYFVVTESYDLEGPFLSRGAAREAADE